MDPLTAGLQLANTIAQIVLLSVEAQPMDVRAEHARIQLEFLKDFLAFVKKFKPPAND